MLLKYICYLYHQRCRILEENLLGLDDGVQKIIHRKKAYRILAAKLVTHHLISQTKLVACVKCFGLIHFD